MREEKVEMFEGVENCNSRDRRDTMFPLFMRCDSQMYNSERSSWAHFSSLLVHSPPSQFLTELNCKMGPLLTKVISWSWKACSKCGGYSIIMSGFRRDHLRDWHWHLPWTSKVQLTKVVAVHFYWVFQLGIILQWKSTCQISDWHDIDFFFS